MKEAPKDKRTKSYKKWKAKFDKQQAKESKGLGDTVEKITEVTGIKKIVKSMFGEDCGCDERKEALNKMLSYKVVNCLEEQEYNYLSDFFDKKITQVNRVEQRELLKIYNRVFSKRLQPSNCSACVRQTVAQLEKIYNQYNQDEK
jgi:hypothetical protein